MPSTEQHFKEHADALRAAAAIQAELLTKVGRIQGTIAQIDKKLDDYGPRIQRLERRASWMAGVVGTLGAAAGLSFDYLKNLFVS